MEKLLSKDSDAMGNVIFGRVHTFFAIITEKEKSNVVLTIEMRYSDNYFNRNCAWNLLHLCKYVPISFSFWKFIKLIWFHQIYYNLQATGKCKILFTNAFLSHLSSIGNYSWWDFLFCGHIIALRCDCRQS